MRDDNRSASRAAKREREGFTQVLRLIERKTADLLIVRETSRASRDIAAFATLVNACEDAGVHFVSGGTRLDLSDTEHRTMAIFRSRAQRRGEPEEPRWQPAHRS